MSVVVVEFYIDDKRRKKSHSTLSKYFELNHCKKIEQGIYNYTKQYCKCNSINLDLATVIYQDKLNDIVYNIDQSNATIKKIVRDIKRNEYNPYNLAFLKPEELDANKWEKILSRKQTTEYTLNNLPTVEWKPCKKCKNNQYYYYQLQTRSADEPMTIFYQCKICNLEYKVNN